MELKFKDATYYGETLNGLMHGVGQLVFNNGNKYIGQFKNNNYDGYGQFHFADGCYYKGTWKNGAFHGKGYFKDKTYYYAGNFENGKFNGSGYIKYNDGTIVFGNWQNGLMFGDNTFYYPNGTSIWKIFQKPGGNVREALTDYDYNQEYLNNNIRMEHQKINAANKQLIEYVKKKLEEIFPKEKAEEKAENKSVNKNSNTTTTPNHQHQETKSTSTQSKQNLTQNTTTRTPETESTDQTEKEKRLNEYNDLMERAQELYEKNDYEGAIKLIEKAKTLTDSEEDHCDMLILVCKASVKFESKDFYGAKKLLELAKEKYPSEVNLQAINELLNNCKNEIKHQILSEKWNKACQLANADKYEEAIRLYKEVKNSTDDREWIDVCNYNIKVCQNYIKEEKINDELDNLYDKACSYFDNGDYKNAIYYFKAARDGSNVYEFQRTCDQDIKDCEDALSSEIENKAIDYFNDGVWYYDHNEYQKAKWKFQDAYDTSNNNDLRKKCEEAIDICNQYITNC